MKNLLGHFNKASAATTYTPEQKTAYFAAINDDNSSMLAHLLTQEPRLLDATAPLQSASGTQEREGIFHAVAGQRGNCFNYLQARNTKPLNDESTGFSPLLSLALENHDHTVALALIDNGAKYQPVDGVTPLMQAFYRNSRNFAQELLNRGASMTDRDDLGRTPLFFAIYNGAAENIAHAKESGGDIHSVTNNGQTMLMEAARCGNTTAIGWMLDEKLDINARDKDGRTALHYLALETSSFNNLNMVERLLHKRAWIDARDNNGQTLEDMLRQSGAKPELLDYISSAARDKNYAREPMRVEIFHEGITRKLKPLRTTRFKAPAA